VKLRRRVEEAKTVLFSDQRTPISPEVWQVTNDVQPIEATCCG